MQIRALQIITQAVKVIAVTKIQQQRKQTPKQVHHNRSVETADQKYIIVQDKKIMIVWERPSI